MELLQMKYFERIAAHENISKAAEDLFVTQPALSASLRRLETELGYTLFDRQGRKLVLNDNGKRFLALTRQVTSLMTQYTQESSASQNPAGSIRLVFNYMPDSFLRLVEEYEQINPQAIFQIATGVNYASLIAKKTYDICLTTGKSRPVEPDNIFLIGQSRMAVLVSKSNPLSLRPVLSFADLKDERFCLGWSGDYIELFNELTAAGLQPNIRYLVDKFIAKVNFVCRCNCVAFMFEDDYKVLDSFAEVVRVPLAPITTDLYLCWQDSIASSPAACAFLNFLKARMNISDSAIYHSWEELY